MSAVISSCGQYRYWLERAGDLLAARPLPFLMLNPSTADAQLDDPTIRRCRGFAKTLGYSGIIVVNLYALRSTDPAALWAHPDPVGPENDQHIIRATDSGEVVCAWGANAQRERVEDVVRMLRYGGRRMHCLGTTRDGHPRHPLYVRADQPLVEWSLA